MGGEYGKVKEMVARIFPTGGKMQHQYNLPLIQHKVDDGSIIQQRASDGYINATALCKAAWKSFKDYMANKSTMEFLVELSTETGLAIQLGEKSLVERKQALIETFPGSPANGGGSWVHPQVAVHLGQWASGKFAVQVSGWVLAWMTGQLPSHSIQPNLPAHLHRYLANDGSVPPGYFSILQETALGLIGPLHMMGFDIPAGWVPDISVGKLFCKYLRDEHGVDTDALQTYSHNYLDGRPLVEAKLYPEELLVIYRAWFREIWLPEYGVRYFRRKDINSLPFLEKMPALSAPRTPVSIPRL